jgi:LysM repeat protein
VVARTYKVRPGDTLTEIARRFGTTVPALLALNGLKKPVIKPGQVLTLPASTAGTVAQQTWLPDVAEPVATRRRVAMAG